MVALISHLRSRLNNGNKTGGGAKTQHMQGLPRRKNETLPEKNDRHPTSLSLTPFAHHKRNAPKHLLRSLLNELAFESVHFSPSRFTNRAETSIRIP
jgi:hypothetical protein